LDNLKENKIDEGRQMFIKAVEIDPANKQIQAIIEKYFYIKNE
jgi:hypothetical protein